VRFRLVVEAMNHLKVGPCLIDGEVVCCDERGVAAFHVLRPTPKRARGVPLRLRSAGAGRHGPAPRAHRGAKATLASILRKSRHGVRLMSTLSTSPGLWCSRNCKMGLGRYHLEAAWDRAIAAADRQNGSSSRTRKRLRSA
jgi:hypothetical protein